jgi:hypothetical protein
MDRDLSGIPDTSAEAHAAQTEAYRRMGGRGRVAIMFRLSDMVRRTSMAGIRKRHPDYDETQARNALLRLLLGDDLVRRVWPDREFPSP